jgi:hypothetical protein
VREPRDPKLPLPRPTRASAALPAKTKAAAKAIMTRLRREAIFIIVFVSSLKSTTLSKDNVVMARRLRKSRPSDFGHLSPRAVIPGPRSGARDP